MSRTRELGIAPGPAPDRPDAASSIEISIDELVLHGFAPGERHAVAAAIERELGTLLAAGGTPALLRRSGEHALVDAGGCHIAEGASAERAGASVASTLYGGLAR